MLCSANICICRTFNTIEQRELVLYHSKNDSLCPIILLQCPRHRLREIPSAVKFFSTWTFQQRDGLPLPLLQTSGTASNTFKDASIAAVSWFDGLYRRVLRDHNFNSRFFYLWKKSELLFENAANHFEMISPCFVQFLQFIERAMNKS